MLFEHRYAGASSIVQGDAATAMSFVPDALRPPTYFRGRLAREVEFREAMSALHDVVISDLRFQPKDRTAYLAWRAEQDAVDLVALTRDRGKVAGEIQTVQAELSTLERAHHRSMASFYAARKRYWDYLYDRDRELWFKLDPVITVHPDQVFFECFSRDESSYGRLAASYEVFAELGERAHGTTNIDYSEALYGELQKIRSYKATHLEVDPSGFDVSTSGEDRYREVKIDLPDSWVRGFLQVSAAATLPMAVVDLHPMDLHNVLLRLRRNKELFGPRSLRWRLVPGEPIVIVLDPWGLEVRCPRSVYRGDRAQEIRTWGRRRLYILERLLARARGVQVHLLGSGQPSFYVVDLGDLSFTLGLSGWSANNWSQAANFDLMAAREDVDDDTRARVFAELGKTWRATPAELGRALGLDPPIVASALAGCVQAGLAIFDLEQGVYRKRELTREPLPIEQLRFASPREESAAKILHQGQIAVDRADDVDGGQRLAGRLQYRGKVFTAQVILDAERRMVDADCTCDHFVRNRLHKGPCDHMLALRAAHRRGVNDTIVGGAVAGDFKTLFREAVVRAMSHRRAGRAGDALRELQKAVRAMPADSQESAQLHEVIAEALAEAGEHEEALTAALRARAQLPRSALALRIHALALARLGRLAESIEVGAILVTVDDAAERWLELVERCLEADDLDQAEQLIGRALARHPADPRLRDLQRRVAAVRGHRGTPGDMASAPVEAEVAPKKPSLWRRMVAKITGKPVASGEPELPVPIERRLEAAATALADLLTVPDPAALAAQLRLAYAAETTDDARLAMMLPVVKANSGGTRGVPDAKLLEILRRALA